MGFDTTVSQRRACRVLGIDLHPKAAYHAAVTKLENAGAPGDGIPDGHTWRSAAKLTDEELARLLRAHETIRALPTEPDRF